MQETWIIWCLYILRAVHSLWYFTSCYFNIQDYYRESDKCGVICCLNILHASLTWCSASYGNGHCGAYDR